MVSLPVILTILMAISFGVDNVSAHEEDKLLQYIHNLTVNMRAQTAILTDFRSILKLMIEKHHNRTVGGPLRNLALKRPAFQSTTSGTGYPTKAVDGSTEYHWWNGHCMATSYSAVESHPWWYVDLGNVYNIQRIVVHTRTDCCYSRMHDVAAFLAEHDKKFSNKCGYYVGPAHKGEEIIFQCPRDTRGRFVKLQIMKGKQNVLEFCEVNVFGW